MAIPDWNIATLDAGLQALDALEDGMFPSEGLAPFCRASAVRARSVVLARRRGPVARLGDLLDQICFVH